MYFWILRLHATYCLMFFPIQIVAPRAPNGWSQPPQVLQTLLSGMPPKWSRIPPLSTLPAAACHSSRGFFCLVASEAMCSILQLGFSIKESTFFVRGLRISPTSRISFTKKLPTENWLWLKKTSSCKSFFGGGGSAGFVSLQPPELILGGREGHLVENGGFWKRPWLRRNSRRSTRLAVNKSRNGWKHDRTWPDIWHPILCIANIPCQTSSCWPDLFWKRNIYSGKRWGWFRISVASRLVVDCPRSRTFLRHSWDQAVTYRRAFGRGSEMWPSGIWM